jgi:hypothetical protein
MYDTYVDANPDLKIINVIGGSGNGLDPEDDIKLAVANFEESTPNVAHVITVDSTTWDEMNSNSDYL